LEKRIPIGRIANPADISETVVFLASDMASYITGQIINVDGGMASTDYTPTEYEEKEFLRKTG